MHALCFCLENRFRMSVCSSAQGTFLQQPNSTAHLRHGSFAAPNHDAMPLTLLRLWSRNCTRCNARLRINQPTTWRGDLPERGEHILALTEGNRPPCQVYSACPVCSSCNLMPKTLNVLSLGALDARVNVTHVMDDLMEAIVHQLLLVD